MPEGLELISQDKDKKCKLIDLLGEFESNWMEIGGVTQEEVEIIPFIGMLSLAGRIIGEREVPAELEEKYGVFF